MPKCILGSALPISRFSWDTGTKSLSAFASDLPKAFIGRVFDDACDLGFQIEGQSKTKIFTLAKDELRNGELVAWHFREYTTEADPWTAVVFND